MQNKTLFGLGAVTAVVVGLAAVVLSRREAAVTETAERARLFPELVDRLNDVATMTVETKDGKIELARAGSQWTVADKGGYPAEGDQVRKTVIGISELRTVERKTSDPERWKKLGVEEPSAEGSASKLVTLSDASGARLAALIVGEERHSQGEARVQELYVRRPGENQAWLAEGDLDVKSAEKDWLQKEILKVESDRVQTIEVEHPDGEMLRVSKEKPGDKDYAVAAVPEGRELRYPGIANAMGGSLGYLNLEDVRPASEIDVADGPLSTARFWTFDGLRITATTKEIDGKTYAKFEAAYDPRPEIGPAAPENAGDAPAAPAEGAGEAEAPADGAPHVDTEPVVTGPVAEVKKTPDEVRKEADALNERLSKWVYQVPQYNRANFTKRMKDLLKEPANEPKFGSDEKPVIIPGDLPPEIQQQIAEHQKSIGNKVVIEPSTEGTSEEGTEAPPEDGVIEEGGSSEADDAEETPQSPPHDGAAGAGSPPK